MKVRKEVVKKWETVVSKVDNLTENQSYILSQLLENLQSQNIEEKDMMLMVPLTCKVFEKIADNLPEKTYPMSAPVDLIEINGEKTEILAKIRKLESKFSVEFCDDLKEEISNYESHLVTAMADELAEEIKRDFLTEETYFPYILITMCIDINSKVMTFRTRYGG